MPSPAPGELLGVHETVLYAPDLDVAGAFYERTLGLRPISRSERGLGFRVNADAVLLIFEPEAARAQAAAANVPAHGAIGPGHVAFRVAPGSLAAWRDRLKDRGIPIELERGWERGGRSLYVRDPAGNSIELLEGEIWPT